MKIILRAQVLLCLWVVSGFGCKSVTESQPPKDADVNAIIIADEPLLVGSAIVARAEVHRIFSKERTYQWTIDDTSFFTVQNADSIYLTLHEPGLHHITVSILDSASTVVAQLYRTVLISMPAISEAKLATFHTVVVKFTGVLIGKNYVGYSDTIPDIIFDTAGLQLQIPIMLEDGGSYYAGNSSGRTYSSNRTYGTSSTNQSIRFTLENNGRILSQMSASYSDSHDDRGFSQQAGESSESVTANQLPLVRMHKDSVEYRLSGSLLKEAVFKLSTSKKMNNQDPYGQMYYNLYVRDSIDWDNPSHPPQLSIFLF